MQIHHTCPDSPDAALYCAECAILVCRTAEQAAAAALAAAGLTLADAGPTATGYRLNARVDARGGGAVRVTYVRDGRVYTDQGEYVGGTELEAARAVLDTAGWDTVPAALIARRRTA